MRVVIAGGHGQIALLLQQQLTDHGDQAVGLVRNPDHGDEVRATGSEVAVVDLETSTAERLAEVLRGADAVVFAAGSGADSGPERKDSVDRGGAVLLAEAAELASVRRYVMVSSMGAEQADPDIEEGFQVYLRAKKAADDDVRARDLDWTIVRPGSLTDNAGTGRIQVGTLDRGEIPRTDVAATLLAVLHTDATAGHTFDLLTGEHDLAEALATL